MNPRVVRVKPLKNYLIEIEFSSSESKIFDVKPYLHYPIYEELNNLELFAKAKVSLGTVVWNDDIDFCPDTLYLESEKLEIV